MSTLPHLAGLHRGPSVVVLGGSSILKETDLASGPWLAAQGTLSGLADTQWSTGDFIESRHKVPCWS
jgi:hypothetical protein